jgi:hypothetical protein
MFPIDRAGVLPVGIELPAVQFLITASRDQLAVGVEHHYRLGAAIEHVDAILLIDGETRDAGLIGRALSGRTRVRLAGGATRGGSRFAFRRWRRRRFQPEEFTRGQRRPVRHESVTAIGNAVLRVRRRKRERQRDRGSRDQQESSHILSAREHTRCSRQSKVGS